MKKILAPLIILLLATGCNSTTESEPDTVNWEKKMIGHSLSDSYENGSTYLSVYSQIYNQTEHRTYDLTVTVSLRNISRTDTVYIDKAEYFDTHGKSIRTYFDQTISIDPMETIEIVIDEIDREGGTGANFIFDWTKAPDTNDPLFEAVMISTSGQQGLSFSTQGKKLD